jgi:hypothetical protein
MQRAKSMWTTELGSARVACATGEATATGEQTVIGVTTSPSPILDVPDVPVSRFVTVRDDVFALGAVMGDLAALVKETFPLDTFDGTVDKGNQKSTPSPLQAKLSEMWSALATTASHLCLYLPECVYKKIELNGKKYPAAMCKVRSDCQVPGVVAFTPASKSFSSAARAPPVNTRSILMKQELQKRWDSRLWILLCQNGRLIAITTSQHCTVAHTASLV